ncbi:MAG: YceI family protein [Parvularculaceae bacterium]|nr:YceI family protein [Parvularculaceae bacterium]
MRKFVLLAAVAALVAVPAGARQGATPPAAPAFPAPSKDPAAAPAGAYNLDPNHTSVVWRVAHIGVSMYQARFDKIAGALVFDPKNPAASKVDVTIDATSVSTGHRDAEGKASFDQKIAEQALGAAKNPTIRFVSKSATRTGPAAGAVTGNLTLNGVTRPTTLDVVFNGGLVHPFSKSYVIGFSARGKIKRSDFGIMNWAGAVGDEVEIAIETEFQKAGK